MRCLFLLIFLALAGCSTAPSPPAVPDDIAGLVKSINTAHSMPAPVASSGFIDEFILVSDFIYQDTDLTGMPKSVFLFPKKPVGDKARDKMRLICEEWMASFPSRREIMSRNLSVDIVPFYWLLVKKAKQPSCDWLIDNYDYTRSMLLARELKLNITKQYIVLTHQSHVVSMDLSKIDKPEDIALSLDTWKSKLTRFPRGSNTLTIVDFTYSAKAVLGRLGTLIALQ